MNVGIKMITSTSMLVTREWNTALCAGD